MNRQLFNIGVWSLVISCFAWATAVAQNQGNQELRGSWQVTDLVDNGRVIPAAAIPGWLPSGGRMEFLDNSIVFTSPRDQQRYARGYSIDATSYPRQFNVIDHGQTTGHGIYRIEDGRLVVCLASPKDTSRPSDFSAPEGSHRLMMVLECATPVQTTLATQTLNLPPPPAVPAPAPPAATPLTDVEISRLLPGTWKCNDLYGAFFLTLGANSVYLTYRESVETSAFQQVFKKLPLSSGTWSLKNGQVVLQSTSAVHADRIYKSFPFTIRSVTPTEMVFVDYSGHVGKAVRTQP